LAVCLGLALAVWAVFGQTLQFDFVNYDDNRYVFENPVVKNGLTLENIGWAFTHNVASNWHPLTVISYMADASLYGAKPGGYHLTNVLLHTVAALLLFAALKEMTGTLWRSAFVAAVFAIHPLRVESVAWVSERKDVLSGLFFMLTLSAYVSYVHQSTVPAAASTFQRFTLHASRFYWLALLFFALGLMSKPMLVTLPFVLLLLDYWPLGRFTPTSDVGVGVHASKLPPFNASSVQPLLLEKIPFFIVSAVSCVVTFLVQQKSGAVRELAAYSLTTRFENIFVAYARYLNKTFWPAGLAVPYPFPPHWPIEEIFLAVVLFIGLGAAALWWGRRFPYVAVGWFWFAGMLVPAIGLVQVGNQSLADRYTYLPQIGLCLLVVWGVAELLGRAALPRRRRLLGSAAVVTLAALMAVAHVQTGYWRDSVSLWQHSLACTSENYVAHHNLGIALADQGKWEEAIDQYRKALQLAPGSPDVRIDLGGVLFKRGQWANAIQLYQQALELQPNSYKAHSSLGAALAAQGDINGAIQHYNQALQLDPDSVEAHSDLGAALAAQGNWAQAVQQCERAVQLAPDQALPQMNLGNVLAMQGKMAEAIPHFERAVQLKPDYAKAHFNLAAALDHEGKSAEARPHFQQALDLATAQRDIALVNAARVRLQPNPSPAPQPPTP
jgi:Flp pilus assembly protein TadD